MNKVILAGLLSLGLAVGTSAADTRIVTAFTGTTGSAAQTYHNIGLGSSQLILGATFGVPTNTDKDNGFYALGHFGLTFDTDLPLLSNFEVTTDFSKGETGELVIGQTLTVSKKYFTKLADKIEVGIGADLLRLNFADEALYIVPNISPVIAFNAKI